MAIATTATLTQEVQDMIAAEMLIQVDDEYVFLRLAPIQTADEDVQKPGTNQVIFDRPTLPTGTYTEVSRRLTEGTPIPNTAQGIAETQVTLTTREYAGPHDGSDINPFGVTEFLKNRALHSVVATVGEFLRRDRERVVDTTLMDLLLAATTVVTPDASSEAAIVAGKVANVLLLRRLNKSMKDRHVPPFQNGRWRWITNTTDEFNMKNDADLKSAFQFQPAANPIFTGLLAVVENIEIYTSTMFATKAVGGGGVTGYQGVAFGRYGIGWGSALPPSVRKADDTDYGRQEKVIWKSEEAVGTLYPDLLTRTITT